MTKVNFDELLYFYCFFAIEKMEERLKEKESCLREVNSELEHFKDDMKIKEVQLE